jgi:Ca-activated chloride channel family protein
MLTLALPWMLLLIPLPLLLRYLLPAWKEPRAALRLPLLAQLAAAGGAETTGKAPVRRRGRPQALLFVLVWSLLVLALARPQWLEPALVRELPTRDLLLAVDLSGSMAAEDFEDADGRRIERLTAVKQVVDDFLGRRQGDRVGLLVFGNAAFVQAPFTQDLDVVRQLLADTVVGMAGPKTAFGDAIGLAISLFERSKLQQRTLIILTDGNDTGSQVPPDKATAIAADQGIVIHTIAIGDPASIGEQALDQEMLETVAGRSGGRYFFAADRDALAQIYDTLDQIETRKVETISQRPRRDLYVWPLGFAFIAALFYHLGAAWRASRRQSAT